MTNSVIASDGIDEFLVNVRGSAAFSPGVLLLKGEGQVLEINTADNEGSWTIKLVPDGFSLTKAQSRPDVTITGGALDLLLVLYRRVPLESSDLRISGDRSIFEFWLAHSALE